MKRTPKLIRILSHCSQILLNSPPKAIHQVLEIILSTFNATRVFFIKNIIDPNQGLMMLYIEDIIDQEKSYDREKIKGKSIPYFPKFEYIYNRMMENKPYLGQPETPIPTDQEILTKQQLSFFYLIPIFIENDFWGILGLDFQNNSSNEGFHQEESWFFETIARMLGLFVDRKQKAENLQKSEQKWRNLYQNLPGGTFIVGHDHRIRDANEFLCQISGYSKDQLIGAKCSILCPKDVNECPIFKLGESSINNEETYIKTKKGEKIPVIKSAQAVTLGKNKLIIGNFQDIRHLKQTQKALREKEAELQQSQKMEAIGRLAGGIAHDFNNILTIITGYSDFILNSISTTDPYYIEIEEISKAGQKARNLTQKLLAFSRKQVLQYQIINLNQIILDFTEMLQRLLGANILLTLKLVDDIWPIKADVSQIEQIIMNLIVNARDAMPKGGTLTIKTKNINFTDKEVNQKEEINYHEYVLLIIADTGEGMTDQTKEHLFEPFFTTKPKDKGTGLGLSTVYGHIQKLNGYINVESKEDQGSVFSLYFPRYIPSKNHSVASKTELFHKNFEGKHILVIEDDSNIRLLIKTILSRVGVHVDEAPNGQEGLRVFKNHPEKYDLIISDVVMPLLGGMDLVEKILEQYPFTKILFISGYIDSSQSREFIDNRKIPLLQKPFDRNSLLEKISEILNTSSKSTESN